VAEDSDNVDEDRKGDSSSWSLLKISPNVVGSVPYKHFRINVYEHAAQTNSRPTLKKFFYAPISLLEPESATSTFNIVTSQAEMKFHIEIWNDYVQQLVVDWIKREIDPTVRESLVQVIPFDKILLVQSLPSSASHQLYRISNDWTPYQLQKEVHFTLNCHFIRDCDLLALQMRHNANHFSSFQLLFSVSSQKTRTKETKIQIETILSGRMVSKLLQRMLPNAEFALLTDDDEKELLTESANAIVIDAIDNSDSIVSSDSKAQIYEFLKEALLLDPSRTIITKQSDHMWDFVFWEERNYRPDRATAAWNEIYKLMDKESKKILIDGFNIEIKDEIVFEK